MHAEPGKYYKASGIAPMGGILLLICAAEGVPLVMGAIYGYVTGQCSYAIVNVILTLIYGGIVGFSLMLAAKVGKVRNTTVGFVAGLLGGLCAVYAAWIWYLPQVSGGIEGSLWDPYVLFHQMSLLAKDGHWTMLGFHPTGFVLWILWAFEAVLITVLSFIPVWGSVSSTPFCEGCRCWMNEVKDAAILQPSLSPCFVRDLEEKKFAELTGLSPAIATKSECLHVHTHQCLKCYDNCYITIVHDRPTSGDYVESNTLVENMGVTLDVLASLKRVMKTSVQESPVEESSEESVEASVEASVDELSRETGDL